MAFLGSPAVAGEEVELTVVRTANVAGPSARGTNTAEPPPRPSATASPRLERGGTDSDGPSDGGAEMHYYREEDDFIDNANGVELASSSDDGSDAPGFREVERVVSDNPLFDAADSDDRPSSCNGSSAPRTTAALPANLPGDTPPARAPAAARSSTRRVVTLSLDLSARSPPLRLAEQALEGRDPRALARLARLSLARNALGTGRSSKTGGLEVLAAATPELRELDVRDNALACTPQELARALSGCAFLRVLNVRGAARWARHPSGYAPLLFALLPALDTIDGEANDRPLGADGWCAARYLHRNMRVSPNELAHLNLENKGIVGEDLFCVVCALTLLPVRSLRLRQGNPGAAIPAYRFHVIGTLLSLSSLDGRAVTADERANALRELESIRADARAFNARIAAKKEEIMAQGAGALGSSKPNGKKRRRMSMARLAGGIGSVMRRVSTPFVKARPRGTEGGLEPQAGGDSHGAKDGAPHSRASVGARGDASIASPLGEGGELCGWSKDATASSHDMTRLPQQRLGGSAPRGDGALKSPGSTAHSPPPSALAATTPVVRALTYASGDEGTGGSGVGAPASCARSTDRATPAASPPSSYQPRRSRRTSARGMVATEALLAASRESAAPASPSRAVWSEQTVRRRRRRPSRDRSPEIQSASPSPERDEPSGRTPVPPSYRGYFEDFAVPVEHVAVGIAPTPLAPSDSMVPFAGDTPRTDDSMDGSDLSLIHYASHGGGWSVSVVEKLRDWSNRTLASLNGSSRKFEFKPLTTSEPASSEPARAQAGGRASSLRGRDGDGTDAHELDVGGPAPARQAADSAGRAIASPTSPRVASMRAPSGITAHQAPGLPRFYSAASQHLQDKFHLAADTHMWSMAQASQQPGLMLRLWEKVPQAALSGGVVDKWQQLWHFLQVYNLLWSMGLAWPQLWVDLNINTLIFRALLVVIPSLDFDDVVGGSIATWVSQLVFMLVLTLPALVLIPLWRLGNAPFLPERFSERFHTRVGLTPQQFVRRVVLIAWEMLYVTITRTCLKCYQPVQGTVGGVDTLVVAQFPQTPWPTGDISWSLARHWPMIPAAFGLVGYTLGIPAWFVRNIRAGQREAVADYDLDAIDRNISARLLAIRDAPTTHDMAAQIADVRDVRRASRLLYARAVREYALPQSYLFRVYTRQAVLYKIWIIAYKLSLLLFVTYLTLEVVPHGPVLFGQALAAMLLCAAVLAVALRLRPFQARSEQMIEVALVGASAITAMIAFVLACVQEFDAGYRDAQLQAATGDAGESTRATGSVGGDNAVAAVLIAVNAVAVAFALGAALVTPLIGCFTRSYNDEVLEKQAEAAAEYGAARESEAAAAAEAACATEGAADENAGGAMQPPRASGATGMASAWFEAHMSSADAAVAPFFDTAQRTASGDSDATSSETDSDAGDGASDDLVAPAFPPIATGTGGGREGTRSAQQHRRRRGARGASVRFATAVDVVLCTPPDDEAEATPEAEAAGTAAVVGGAFAIGGADAGVSSGGEGRGSSTDGGADASVDEDEGGAFTLSPDSKR